MIRSTAELYRAGVSATDGDIGSVKDALFDDEEWTIRYFVVDAGGWLVSRKVLISPMSVRRMSLTDERLEVNCTREQVKNSPDIDTDKPISRQHEATYLDYYGYGYYWAGPFIGSGMGLSGVVPPLVDERLREAREKELADADPHLRSMREVSGYHIQASDGEIGHVDDFLFDDETWMVRYLVIDTRNWLPGKHVLVAPDWVDHVSWADRKVTIDLTREAVRTSPEFSHHTLLNDNYERELYLHYGRETRRAMRREDASQSQHRSER